MPEHSPLPSSGDVSIEVGNRNPTSKDVAQLAGVSQSTVSYVLNGSRSVSKETKEKVERAIRKLGYVPSQGARALRTGRNQVLGLVIQLDEGTNATETMPYINGIIDQARSYDYEVVISTAGDNRESEARLRKLLDRRICDGFIVMDIALDDPRLPLMKQVGVPTVFMGLPENVSDIDVVDFNAYKGGETLAKYMIDAGVGHVCTILDDSRAPEDYTYLCSLLEGIENTFQAAELSNEILFLPQNDPRLWRQSLEEKCVAHMPGLGIILRNSEICKTILELAKQHDWEYGKDLHLLGHFSDRLAASFVPPVSNLSMSGRETGSLAVDMLMERLADPNLAYQIKLVDPAPIEVRETS